MNNACKATHPPHTCRGAPTSLSLSAFYKAEEEGGKKMEIIFKVKKGLLKLQCTGTVPLPT